MYQKAGIIIGGLLIIIAIVIFVIASNASKTEETPDIPTMTTTTNQTPPQQTQPPIVAPHTTTTQAITTPAPIEQTQPITTTPAPVEQTQPITTTPAPVEQTQPEETPSTGSAIIKIDASSLPAYVDTTDIGTVVGRNVYSYKHQVIYSLVINTTTHGQLEWFTTLTNYNLADGTRLECSIRTFNAQSGAFPSIISVRAI